ncbi:MAG: glycosyltransferase family 2 protein [Agathobacter sp.]|nr:glycosyltransferase family 2 protein [Agathobacter sp.]
MGDLISIIVPIYKVEAYLERCVNSLLSQSYKNIEIILVDDGSPDNCPLLCDELKQKDSRIRVLHKENGGLSSARNAGLRIANGEYIAFVDSDDYIAVDMLEKMHEAIVKDGTDLCICDFCSVDEAGKSLETEEEQFAFENTIFSMEETLKLVCGYTKKDNVWRLVPAWNKLYHKHLFENCSFEEGKLHEDEFFIHHVISQCNTISLISDKLYYYVQRENSIVNSKYSIKRFDAAYAYKDRYLFVKNIDKQLGVAAIMQLCEYLAINLQKLDVRNHHQVIGPMVWYVLVRLFINGKFGYVKWLLLEYLKQLFKKEE